MFGIGVCKARPAHSDDANGLLSVYLRMFSPDTHTHTPSLMFCSMFVINAYVAASNAWGKNPLNHAVGSSTIRVQIHKLNHCF